jgi:hypothetical protein
MGGMNWKCPSTIKGTMNHAKTSFSTEICPGAIISVVQYLAPLRVRAQDYLFVTKRSKENAVDEVSQCMHS